MKTKRKSFVMYSDYRDYFNMLDDTHLGAMLRQFFNYTDGLPDDTKAFTDSMRVIYRMMQKNYDRDTEKYDKICEHRSSAAKQREQKKHEALSGSKPSYDAYEIEQQAYEKYRNL